MAARFVKADLDLPVLRRHRSLVLVAVAPGLGHAQHRYHLYLQAADAPERLGHDFPLQPQLFGIVDVLQPAAAAASEIAAAGLHPLRRRPLYIKRYGPCVFRLDRNYLSSDQVPGGRAGYEDGKAVRVTHTFTGVVQAVDLKRDPLPPGQGRLFLLLALHLRTPPLQQCLVTTLYCAYWRQMSRSSSGSGH